MTHEPHPHALPAECAEVATLVPIDTIQLPAAMNGSGGNKRADSRRAQIGADNDVDAAKAWLARFQDTKTTFDNTDRKPNDCCFGARCATESVVITDTRGLVQL
jgi:hypothetical protein